jgi:hypothetical protein
VLLSGGFPFGSAMLTLSGKFIKYVIAQIISGDVLPFVVHFMIFTQTRCVASCGLAG